MFFVTWDQKEKINNPYWTASLSCLEPEHLEIVIEKHAFVDDVGQLILYRGNKHVKFFEVNRQIFPKFIETIKVEF